jgi:pyridoxal phosphate enzyme (YggS family)
MSVAARVAELRARIPVGVRLVAMSKGQPVEAVRQALAAGQLEFGENYAQELRDKFEAAPGATWHFTGALQRNKVKYVVGRASLIHDVDSLELGQEIGRRSGDRRSRVLVGVNFGEAQKSGVPIGEALGLCRALVGVPGLELRGLMCLPPWHEDPEASAPHFAELADLAARGRAEGLPLHELSMGMSHDWEVAVRHGATIVRVGTAIFGERNYAR